MRRSILISFAVGSAVTSIAWWVAQAIGSSGETLALMAVSDKESIDSEEVEGLSNEDIGILLSGAGFVRRCGADNFVTNWDGGSHSVPSTAVEITPESADTLDCILENAPIEGFPTRITFKVP